jgi:hypothetical protein
MAEGGTLAWKRQVIDESRGPAGRYDSMRLPADLPQGVTWQQNPETREWTLVRLDHPQQQRQHRQKYKLERAMAWNPHTGREQWTVKLRPITVANKKSSGKNLDGDEETVATATETINTSTTNNDDAYFNEDLEEESQIEDSNTNSDDDGMPEAPVLGKDYVVHTILSSDTFQGLLLRYKIKAVELRRVNQFSGTNLALAPSHLIIPLTGERSLDSIRLQDTDSHEYKLQVVLTEYPQLTVTERKAYLEMSNWNVDAALKEMSKDMQWEEDQETIEALRRSMEHIKVPTVAGVVDDESSLATPLLTSAVAPLEVETL